MTLEEAKQVLISARLGWVAWPDEVLIEARQKVAQYPKFVDAAEPIASVLGTVYDNAD